MSARCDAGGCDAAVTMEWGGPGWVVVFWLARKIGRQEKGHTHTIYIYISRYIYIYIVT